MATCFFQLTDIDSYQSTLYAANQNYLFTANSKPMSYWTQTNANGNSFRLPGGLNSFCYVKRLTCTNKINTCYHPMVADALNNSTTEFNLGNSKFVVWVLQLSFCETFAGKAWSSNEGTYAWLGYEVSCPIPSSSNVKDFASPQVRFVMWIAHCYRGEIYSHFFFNDTLNQSSFLYEFFSWNSVVSLAPTQWTQSNVSFSASPNIKFTVKSNPSPANTTPGFYISEINSVTYPSSSTTAMYSKGHCFAGLNAKTMTSVEPTKGQALVWWFPNNLTLNEFSNNKSLFNQKFVPAYDLTGANVVLGVFGCTNTYNVKADFSIYKNDGSMFELSMGLYEAQTAFDSDATTVTFTLRMPPPNYLYTLREVFVYLSFVGSGVFGGQLVDNYPVTFYLNEDGFSYANSPALTSTGTPFLEMVQPAPLVLMFEENNPNMYGGLKINSRTMPSIDVKIATITGQPYPIITGKILLEVCFLNPDKTPNLVSYFNYK